LPHLPGQPATNKDRKFPPEVLSTEEVAALIAGCSHKAPTGIRNRALIWLLYRSGLRVSEALDLRPADADLARHALRVLHGKGDKATTRGFHPTADDALARWLDTRRQLAVRGGPLFCTLKGGPVSDRYVRNLLHRLADQAGIDKRVHPHGLRHTYAAELEDAGLTVSEISKLLGHSSAAVTARYLDHLTNDRAIAALETAELPQLDDTRPPSRRSRRRTA
jgi:integrase/recombinase XerD